MVPWTNAQTNQFFTAANQMAIPVDTLEALREEGIERPDDLIEFDNEKLQNIAKTFRAGDVTLGAKSIGRLVEAANIVHYYDIVGRELTPANMTYLRVIRNFTVEWSALKEIKDKDEPDTPKLGKGVTVMQWSESFVDILHRCIGVRMVPLAYVVRELEDAPDPIPVAAPNQPWAEQFGSIETELIAATRHDHALFRQDNAAVYYKMEEATRGTNYAASIKPFQRNKNGRGAYLAIIGQHAGRDKWEKEIQKHANILHNRKWKGQNNYTLEKHVGVHRHAYVTMEAGAAHVEYQLPNEHTRVTLLLDSIECGDATLQAAMASIQANRDEDGPRNNFERTAELIVQADPVAKRLATQKRAHGQISVTEGETTQHASVSGINVKSGLGPKTGVHLRWYKKNEFHKLSSDEKKELEEWRQTDNGKKAIAESRRAFQQSKKDDGNNGGKKLRFSKKISSAIKDEVESTIHAITGSKPPTEEDKARSFIMSCVEEAMQKKSGTTTAQTSAVSKTDGESFLKSIMKKAKNNN